MVSSAIGEVVGGLEFLEAHLLLVPYHYIIQGNIHVGIPTLYLDNPSPKGILTREYYERTWRLPAI